MLKKVFFLISEEAEDALDVELEHDEETASCNTSSDESKLLRATV